MSAFKKLERKDVIVKSYKAKKDWSISGSDASSLGISTFDGQFFDEYLYPSSPNYIKSNRYRSLRQLYFSNFITGSFNQTGSFDNFLQTTLYQEEKRNLQNTIGGLQLPKTVIGDYIEPGSISFAISNLNYIENQDDYVATDYVQDFEGGAVYDDGEGRLICDENGFLGKNRGDYVGDVIYQHGMIIFTEPTFASYFSNLSSPRMSWTSNYNLLSSTYNIRVKDSEFNFTQNPSSHSGSLFNSNVTGSEFSPYLTTVGLYNDSNELIAVAKLSRPIPKSKSTDMTIVINLDM